MDAVMNAMDSAIQEDCGYEYSVTDSYICVNNANGKRIILDMNEVCGITEVDTDSDRDYDGIEILFRNNEILQFRCRDGEDTKKVMMSIFNAISTFSSLKKEDTTKNIYYA